MTQLQIRQRVARLIHFVWMASLWALLIPCTRLSSKADTNAMKFLGLIVAFGTTCAVFCSFALCTPEDPLPAEDTSTFEERATAQEAARQGARPVLAARGADVLEAVVAGLDELGFEAIAVVADVAERQLGGEPPPAENEMSKSEVNDVLSGWIQSGRKTSNAGEPLLPASSKFEQFMQISPSLKEEVKAELSRRRSPQ